MSEPRTARGHNAPLTGDIETMPANVRIPGTAPVNNRGALPEGFKDKLYKSLNCRIRHYTNRIAERLRDELKVRHGRINISDAMLERFLSLEQQRDMAIVGRLTLLVDGTDNERLWAVDVTP